MMGLPPQFVYDENVKLRAEIEWLRRVIEMFADESNWINNEWVASAQPWMLAKKHLKPPVDTAYRYCMHCGEAYHIGHTCLDK